MKLRFYKVDELDKNLKATVHKTGKLGFTQAAAKKLDLAHLVAVDIGRDEDDPADGNLYVVANGEGGEFKVIKAGQYYYLPTKILFDNLKIDYVTENVVFDISTKIID